jgi:nucleoside triphosphatase
MRARTIVSAIIYNDAGQILICKTPKDLGVYPGQWALPGGGVEPDETMWEALSREVREEVSIEITQAEPWLFQDDSREKLRQDGSHELTYMIFLLFNCQTRNTNVCLNEEFEEFAWVEPEKLREYDLNPPSILTFKKKGYLR